MVIVPFSPMLHQKTFHLCKYTHPNNENSQCFLIVNFGIVRPSGSTRVQTKRIKSHRARARHMHLCNLNELRPRCFCVGRAHFVHKGKTPGKTLNPNSVFEAGGWEQADYRDHYLLHDRSTDMTLRYSDIGDKKRGEKNQEVKTDTETDTQLGWG